MSSLLITWAMTQRCPTATAKLLLIAIADQAGDDGHARPDAGVISTITQCSDSTLERQIARLREAGLADRRRERAQDGTFRPWEYLAGPRAGLWTSRDASCSRWEDIPLVKPIVDLPPDPPANLTAGPDPATQDPAPADLTTVPPVAIPPSSTGDHPPSWPATRQSATRQTDEPPRNRHGATRQDGGWTGFAPPHTPPEGEEETPLPSPQTPRPSPLPATRQSDGWIDAIAATLHRRDADRLAADPGRHALADRLAALAAAGWTPAAAAARIVAAGPLDDARSIARVLANRAATLAGQPPAAAAPAGPDPACPDCAGSGMTCAPGSGDAGPCRCRTAAA